MKKQPRKVIWRVTAGTGFGLTGLFLARYAAGAIAQFRRYFHFCRAAEISATVEPSTALNRYCVLKYRDRRAKKERR